jgi:hypothetical protein
MSDENKKGTIFNITAVSPIALKQALEQNKGISRGIMSVEMSNYDDVENDDERYLEVTMSEIAMNSDGYIEGDESVTIRAPLLKREFFGAIYGIPTKGEPFMVIPEMFDIVERNNPDPYDNSDEDDMEFHGYEPPEDDYWWQMWDAELTDAMNNLPDAKFNSETRTWEIGEEVILDLPGMEKDEAEEREKSQ